jgi:hypothetical protein
MKYKFKPTAQVIAERVSDVLFGDSRVELSPRTIRIAMYQDFVACGKYPTKAEAELLVTGDDSGQVPVELGMKFKHLHKLVADQF